MYFPTPTLDDRDREIIAERMAKYNQVSGPRVGDWVTFADGGTHRIGEMWPAGDDDTRMQLARGGTFYLGGAYASYGGSFYGTFLGSTVTLTGGTRDGAVWIFHHDMRGAGNDVSVATPFRVYTCTENTPTS